MKSEADGHNCRSGHVLEISVKPSAQPTLVRIQDLPRPKTSGQVPCGVVLAICRRADRPPDRSAAGRSKEYNVSPGQSSGDTMTAEVAGLSNCSGAVEQRLSRITLRSAYCWSLVLTGQVLATMPTAGAVFKTAAWVAGGAAASIGSAIGPCQVGAVSWRAAPLGAEAGETLPDPVARAWPSLGWATFKYLRLRPRQWAGPVLPRVRVSRERPSAEVSPRASRMQSRSKVSDLGHTWAEDCQRRSQWPGGRCAAVLSLIPSVVDSRA